MTSEHFNSAAGIDYVIDIRSDTVTRPTASMYEAIANADLGDDGLDGDPTAAKLEQSTAKLLGKAAGVFMPSATMANLTAIMAQAGRQEVVLAHADSHIYGAERGGAAISGAFYTPLAGAAGAMDMDALRRALSGNRSKLRTAVVCLETSHNSAGGTVLPLAYMEEVKTHAHAAGAVVHLDGARLFNAAACLGVPARQIADHCDTVSVCLSKGLSAPMGAVLVGPRATIAKARELRRALGGNQRQVGIAAAAGLVAIETMVDRLVEDQKSAAALSSAVAKVATIKVSTPQTNIVLVDTALSGKPAKDWEKALREAGVLVRPWGEFMLRCVTHRHISIDDVKTAAEAFNNVAARFAAS
ncbi:threonine aldolase [Bordetella sp. N]|nr:threonine aldolase [Bordetella sp. N]